MFELDKNGEEKPYYETLAFTFLYLDELNGAIEPQTGWVWSLCDIGAFKEFSDFKNYQEPLRIAKKCTAEPAYIFDW